MIDVIESETLSPHKKRYRTIDLSGVPRIQVDRYNTLDTLDLANPDILAARHLWRRSMGDIAPRPRCINLVDPLYVPYGALDIRLSQTITSDKKYPDLFRRQLPYALLARRQIKETKTLWKKHKKRIIGGIAGVIAFSVPILGYVGYSVSNGYEKLQTLASTRDGNVIRDTIRSARGDFERAGFLFTPFSWIPLSSVDSVSRATHGWLALTRGLDSIAQVLPNSGGSGFTIKKEQVDPFSYRTPAKDISPLEAYGITSPTDWIRTHHSELVTMRDEFQKAGTLYAGVRTTGARTIQMQKIGQLLARLSGLIDWSLQNESQLLKIFGDINPQRYIVFNQNRDEIRANGGFPGSIISFTLYKGNILDYRTDDVYYYDWNLYPYKEIPPPGIALLTDNYGLRDVNYYPDFRDTLQKANSFIERSGDASVTHAIALHQWIVEDILARVWPVTVSGVVVPFDEKNFSLLMSTLVENKYAKEKTPKDILFRFIESFGKKIQEKNAYIDVLDILTGEIKKWEILFASRDADTDAWLSPYKKVLPWQSSSPNWIYPLWTSVSGNKSDRYIERTYRAITKKTEGCTYENTITLQTQHTYSKKDSDTLTEYFGLFGIRDGSEQAKMRFIQGDGKNRAFVRVFAPLWARLVWSGSDITTNIKDTATVFSFNLDTPLSTTTSKSFRYMIDIPRCESYTGGIDWWQQPGLRTLTIE